MKIDHDNKTQKIIANTSLQMKNKLSKPKIRPSLANTDKSAALPSSSSPSSYGEMLPNVSYQKGAFSFAPSNKSNNARSGEKDGHLSQETALDSQQVAGYFDIPLVFRKNGMEGKAVAKIIRKSISEWCFEYLDGQSMLRAVLFEGLKEKANSKIIMHLFEVLRTNEYLIVLKYVYDSSTLSMGQFDQKIQVENNKITITNILNRNTMPVFKPDPELLTSDSHDSRIISGTTMERGVVLPDKYAEMAKKADLLRRDKLLQSPAYFGPIRDRCFSSEPSG